MKRTRRYAVAALALLFGGCAARQPLNPYAYAPPQPHVGFRPHTPIVFAPPPGIPIGYPVPTPGSPTVPPTTPISQPSPENPPDGFEEAWSPWPLPPNQKLVAATPAVPAANSAIEQVDYREAAPFEIATSDHSLKYRGGHTIRDLRYVNLYVGGESAWQTVDVEQIETNLSAAMRDAGLNGVLRQYFDGPPTSEVLPPHPLVGYVPELVSRGDIENYLLHLDRLGYLRSYDFETTVFNVILPPGTVLSDQPAAAHTTPRSNAAPDAVNSLAGLGGYHGSVVPSDGRRVYFSASVFSERASDGRTNGVPVFAEAWKNVVATVYHQMMEVRTDPDVEDALRGSPDLNSGVLGWVSDSGREIGDFLNDDTVPVTDVIREVPLTSGKGSVPVQLPYSNKAGGIEGPSVQGDFVLPHG